MIKAKVANVKKARIEQGYSQADICKGTGLNIATYCMIENGKASPRPGTAKKIYSFLNRTFDDLFDLVEDRQEAEVGA